MGADGKSGLVSKELLKMTKAGSCPVIDINGDHYQIKLLKEFNGGESFSGEFAKIRMDDISDIGSITNLYEKPIPLANDEGLLDRNHFLFYKKNELLVFQTNKNAGSAVSLGEYFTTAINHTTVFHPVLKKDALSRMMNNQMTPKSIEISVARPTNPDLYPSDDFSQHLFKAMKDIGGTNAHIKIGVGAGNIKQGLFKKVKNSLGLWLIMIVQQSLELSSMIWNFL